MDRTAGVRSVSLMLRCACQLLFLIVVAAPALRAADGVAFFETKVRPLLITHCYDCHSAEKKIKGDLALDTKAGWQQGGEHGPALVPGKPDESLLIKAISYRDTDLQMPPKQRLTPDEVEVLRTWVQMGAPDPRESTAPAAAKRVINIAEGQKHWAFQPIKPVRGTIDQLAKSTQPRADPRTLIRRAYFDLIGLPPSYEEVEAFVADFNRESASLISHPSSFLRLIDKLLDDPRYGQRWGRHWLDVVRYADTIEQSVDGERRIPFAHTYRDYVIDAFNSDKPFDRFVLEQIAADRLPDATPSDLRALGMFGVGRQFTSNADGPALRVDDRIDVVGRGFLGLTLACARCHDHKFDPVPTRDYYSLYGILDSLEEPLDLPAVRLVPRTKKVGSYEERRAAAIKAYEAHVDACVASSTQHLKDFATEYLQYLVRSSPNHRTTDGDIPLDTPRGWLVYHAPDRWTALLKQCQQRDEPFFRLWHQLMALPKESFAEVAAKIDLRGHHPAVVAAFSANPPQTMLDAATIYGAIIAEALKTNQRDVVDLIFGKGSPVPPQSRDEVRYDLHRFLNEKQLVNRSDGEKAGKLLGELHVIEAEGPVDRAMLVRPTPKPTNPRVFIRGDMKQLGDAVPRRFLQVLNNVDAREYADDGRLQLAQAIASPQNPLTARVIVNRVWQQHFGTGFVAAADDFGFRSEPPTNSALLDHLASWFMQHGWSIKALHRYILSSDCWQQQAAPRRLEFEPMRDALLQVAGVLDARTGGRGALLADSNHRRAVYGYTDRYRIPALMRNFDVANPDTSIAKRAETLVPLQALFLMNSSFVHQQAEAVLKRPEIAKATSEAAKITMIFRTVLSRDPATEELSLTQAFLAQQSEAQRWSSFVQGLLLSNEFVFVD